MKTATVRQLRHHFGSVLDWIEQGDAVRISKRGKTIALLCPPAPAKPVRSRKRPNLLARFKRLYGDKALAGNIVVEDRQLRPY